MSLVHRKVSLHTDGRPRWMLQIARSVKLLSLARCAVSQTFLPTEYFMILLSVLFFCDMDQYSAHLSTCLLILLPVQDCVRCAHCDYGCVMLIRSIVRHQAGLLWLDYGYRFQFYSRGAGDSLWPVLLYPEKDRTRKNRKTATVDRAQWWKNGEFDTPVRLHDITHCCGFAAAVRSFQGLNPFACLCRVSRQALCWSPHFNIFKRGYSD